MHVEIAVGYDTTLFGDENRISGNLKMTAVYGRIGEFDSTKEEWPQYVERLNHLFEANGINEAEKKRAIFLTVIGPETYRLVRSLVHPAQPGDKSYAELSEALTAHYKPTPSEIVQRCRFNTHSASKASP